jgi:membrane protein
MSSRARSASHPSGLSSVIGSLALASVLGMAGRALNRGFAGNATPETRNKPQSAQPQKADHQRAENAKAGVSATEAKSGKGASGPADIPSPGWWAILKRTFAEVNGDRVLAVAGGVTFYGLLSLFPAVTVLVSVYGLFADPQSISEHLAMLSSVLPEGAMNIISEQVTRIASGDGAKLGLAALAGLLVALWSANSAMKAMMDALNIAYDAEEKRSFIMLNLVSLGFTLAAIVGLLVLISAIAVVPAMLNTMQLGVVGDVLVDYGRWPLVFALGIAGLAVLYRYGPSRPDVGWRWITPGSLIATLALVVFSMLFSWYAANFGKFNETYGSLGAVIGFLTWMWLSASIVLIGAELNAEIENQARAGKKPGETGKAKTKA